MKFKYTILLALVAAYFLTISGCRTDFELYAPPKDIFAVYCVLNPSDSIHYVRIGAAYQVEGDALEYAAENDLSVSGLSVKLRNGGQIFEAEEVDSFPKDVGGLFFPYSTIYRITTTPSTGDTVHPGFEYSLEIHSPDDSVSISAKTLVPHEVRVKGMGTVAAGGTQQRRQRFELTRDVEVSINKGSAVAYELRVIFNYEADGVPQTVVWGPPPAFTESVRCSGSTSEICYEIPEYGLIGYFGNFMDDPGVVYTYDEREQADIAELHLLSRALEFQVTAMDQELYNYILVNDPKVTDLSGSRPEYTNLSGTIDVVGVFGSVFIDEGHVLMSKCSQYLLNLNDTPEPSGCIPPP